MKRSSWFFISIITAGLLYILLLNVGLYRNPDHRQEHHVMVVLKATVQPMDFWDVVKTGMEEAAREHTLQLSFIGPPHEQMVDLQVELMLEGIEQEPDLIILAAGDVDLLVDPIARAHEKGIAVIIIDSGTASSLPISFVATDNIEAGIRAGTYMGQVLEQRIPDRPGRIMIMSHSRGITTAIERESGVRRALEKHEIIGTWYCDIDHQVAYDLTREVLSMYHIDGIIGLNEVSTLGVADAVSDLGLGGVIPIVGFDHAAQEMAYLESGVLEATVVQRPYNMGYISVTQAARHLQGKPVKPVVNTGSKLITRENMFEPKYQELLFPFEKLNGL